MDLEVVLGNIVDAKKDTFITTAQQYANAARLSFVNNEYRTVARGNCIAIKTSKIELESGSRDSSFGNGFTDNESYVLIANVAGTNEESDRYEYYVQMVDEDGNGFGLMREADLERENVIQEAARTSPNPSGSYKKLPESVSTTSPTSIKLFAKGVTNETAKTCNLVEIF